MTTREEALLEAAAYLETVGLISVPDFIRSIATSKLPEYVDRAIEAGVADLREQLFREATAERLQLRMEYELLKPTSRPFPGSVLNV
jgi:hypothetical protein